MDKNFSSPKQASKHASFKEDSVFEESLSEVATGVDNAATGAHVTGAHAAGGHAAGDNAAVPPLENKEEEPPLSPEDCLKEEIASLKDQLLRALAEVENIQKRSVREQEDIRKYAIVHFARDLLSVSDNLARALESIQEDALRQSPLLETVVNGVTMIQKELFSVFERQHIHKIPALGEKFNPHLHQAMLEVEGRDDQVGKVIQVLQEGYQIHDRLLRPSLVSVGKAALGGSKPPPE